MTSGSKPAADIRWFRNGNEVAGKNHAMSHHRYHHWDVVIYLIPVVGFDFVGIQLTFQRRGLGKMAAKKSSALYVEFFINVLLENSCVGNRPAFIMHKNSLFKKKPTYFAVKVDWYL